MIIKKAPALAAVFVVLFSFCAAAIAQVTTGSILGTVRDASGAVVPGATVTVTDTGKGTIIAKQTDTEGNYSVPYLLPGTYNISVELKGFKRSVANNVVVDIDQKANLDFTLETGGASETVEVTSAPPLIRLDSSELGEVVGKREVQNLPLNGRNFAQLVYLVPGVTSGQAGENLSGSSSFNPRAASNFNALGSQANTNAWMVDGIVDNEYTFNTVMVQPSVESIAEFKVLTGSYAANYGVGAGVVSVSTRSGANALHGEVFLYLRNSAVDARNYFARQRDAETCVSPRPVWRRGGRCDHQGQAVLLCGLLWPAFAEGHCQPKQCSDCGGTDRRLQRLHQYQRHADSHLRSAHDSCDHDQWDDDL
jgi:Carboxypeptidase regulatory-like domain/TonB-dependent Receptor Plug Domain